MSSDRRISVVLLLLRLSVFIVMLVWTLDPTFRTSKCIIQEI
jgi:hypothetical protein